MGSEHMTIGELSSFLMYAFWVGISIAGEDTFNSLLILHLLALNTSHKSKQVTEGPCSISNCAFYVLLIVRAEFILFRANEGIWSWYTPVGTCRAKARISPQW